MTFTSLIFIGFVVLTAIMTQSLTGWWRPAAMLATSMVFVDSYLTTPLAILPLTVFVIGGYGGIILAQSGRTRHGVAIAITATVAVFIWMKRYPFVAWMPQIPFAYTAIGASYILFRILHLIIEVGDGALARPHFARYLAYLFFFPSFLSGPINRYEPFARDLDSPAAMNEDQAYTTLHRLLRGFVKVAVIGEGLHLFQGMVGDRMSTALTTGAPWYSIAGYYAIAAPIYFVFLYANFSGYTDMAIAIGRLFGVILPENFNRPFTASNFQDLWSRWHITLSEWFKIYVFNPLLKLLMTVFPNRKVEPYLVIFALLVIFLVLGAWHGASWEFMLCGVLFAGGVSMNKLYQVELSKRLGKNRYRVLAERPTYLWVARGLTLAYFSICITTFWRSVGEMSDLVQRMGAVGTILTTVMMMFGFVVVLISINWIQALSGILMTKEFGVLGKVANLVFMLLLLVFAVPLLNSSTDFVYKAF